MVKRIPSHRNILLAIILVIPLIIVVGYYLFFSKEHFKKTEIENGFKLLQQENLEELDTTYIPLILWQTYVDKTKIPQKVLDSIKKCAPEYEHHILDDAESEVFIKKYFKPYVLETFHILKGAHKADLIRYCLLYVYGGLYMDIKTELIKPLREIFTRNKNIMYTVIDLDVSIYQGIICSPPRNPFFLSLIRFMISHKKPPFYHIFCKDFRNTMVLDLIDKKFHPGLNRGYSMDYFLFKEKLVDPKECHDGTDRYGFCSFIHDENGRKIFKTRTSDYPWY